MLDGFYIIGAGGFGREVLEYALDAASAGGGPSPLGFLDDRADALGGRRIGGFAVVGGTEAIGAVESPRYVIAVGDPATRLSLRRRVQDSGGELVSVVHPSATVSASAQLGSGCVVAPFGMVAAWSRVEANVAINAYSLVGHDAWVGADSVISPYAGTMGDSRLGEGCFMGAQSMLAPGVSVGAWSKVAAGTIVTRDAEAGSMVAGSPAKSRVMFMPPK